MDKNKDYLGDGVYASDDGYHIILETSNGVSTTNQIYLESNVIQSLINFIARARNLEITAKRKPGCLGDVNGPGTDPDTL